MEAQSWQQMFNCPAAQPAGCPATQAARPAARRTRAQQAGSGVLHGRSLGWAWCSTPSAARGGAWAWALGRLAGVLWLVRCKQRGRAVMPAFEMAASLPIFSSVFSIIHSVFIFSLPCIFLPFTQSLSTCQKHLHNDTPRKPCLLTVRHKLPARTVMLRR